MAGLTPKMNSYQKSDFDNYQKKNCVDYFNGKN